MSARSKKSQISREKSPSEESQIPANNKTHPSSSRPRSAAATTSTSTTTTVLSQTLAITANLANLLPTGTLLAFQLLIPSFTNNGSCDSATSLMTLLLLLVLGSSAFLACFTDSFQHQDNRVIYGLATPGGMWIFDPPPDLATLPDLTKYKIRIIDCFHGVLSVLVFVAVSLRDKNVVQCFYPSPDTKTKEVLDILPLGIGVICSMLFVVFPTTRHGIGYPVTNGGYKS
ncbi:uncharacterized protein LOC110034060 [Phalaenopsis equestris]|uniref:uncharacterized protein LOC110034060 n=1 Tax=Phalaenopsis equestris TaxID=78828 RepID=UPI0009E1B551|nr:uncharacterized protein LOC110034060 [Phalaenopsis equestris]